MSGGKCSVLQLSDQKQGTLLTFKHLLGSGRSVKESNQSLINIRKNSNILLVAKHFFFNTFSHPDKPQDQTEGISGVFTQLSWNVPFQEIPITIHTHLKETVHVI